jgi:hypothetical protein
MKDNTDIQVAFNFAMTKIHTVITISS